MLNMFTETIRRISNASLYECMQQINVGNGLISYDTIISFIRSTLK